MEQIKCLKCGSTNLQMNQIDDDWFLDQNGFMKRRNKITRNFTCLSCTYSFEKSFKNSSVLSKGKIGFMIEIDLNEWNLEIVKNPKTGEDWAGYSNGHHWAIVKVYKEGSYMYIGSMFGVIAETLKEHGKAELESLLGTHFITAQVGFNKSKRNGKEEWKQTLLFNDEFDGL
jgi:predicted nucleic-acid-binding Zn-ribbon protein